MRILKLFLVVLIVSSCVTSPPKSPNNICEIFDEKRTRNDDARRRKATK